jgi:hypothetical protein
MGAKEHRIKKYYKNNVSRRAAKLAKKDWIGKIKRICLKTLKYKRKQQVSHAEPQSTRRKGLYKE